MKKIINHIIFALGLIFIPIIIPVLLISAIIHYQVMMVVVYLDVRKRIRNKNYNIHVLLDNRNYFVSKIKLINKTTVNLKEDIGIDKEWIDLFYIDIFGEPRKSLPLYFEFPIGIIFRKLIESNIVPILKQHKDLYFL